VTGHFGICRGLAQGRNKEFRPTIHRRSADFPVQSKRT
jgi:hypothetical protein